MKKMYNEEQKKAFIRQLKKGKEPQVAENAFAGIESYERKNNKDICDIAPRQYPKILTECCNNIHIQRYSYYMDMIKALLNYREYCVAHGLITPALYFEFANDKFTYRKLLEEFKSNTNTVILPDPKTLYKFYSELLGIYKESTPEDFYLGLLILYYYGLTNDDIAEIKRSQIRQESGVTEINMGTYTIFIEGKCGKHIFKIAQSTVNATHYSERFKVYHMNSEFVYGRDNDTDAAQRQRTVHNYARYTVGKLQQQSNTPTLSDVKHQGAIYRMCRDLIKDGIQKDEFFNLTNKEIYSKYYCYFHNIRTDENLKVGTSQFKTIEVVYDLEKEWQYLEEQHR